MARLIPIENRSSTFSSLADLFSHFRYGPNLPEFKVISCPFSGCCPNTLGREHKYFALSKSTLSTSIPFGIETFLRCSFSIFFFLPFFFLVSSSSFSFSNCK